MKLRLSPLRMHQIMYTMIYPAVLGSFLYTFWDNAARFKFSLADPVPWLGGGLFIALLTLDYVYSLGVEIQKRYSVLKLVVDLVIVVLIYASMNALLKSYLTGLENVSVWVYLGIVKGLSFLWELIDYWQQWKADRNAVKRARLVPRVNVESDLVLAGLCGLFWFLSPKVPPGMQLTLIVIFFVLDGLFYIDGTGDQ